MARAPERRGYDTRLRRVVVAAALATAPALACELLVGIGDDTFRVATPDAARRRVPGSPRHLRSVT